MTAKLDQDAHKSSSISLLQSLKFIINQTNTARSDCIQAEVLWLRNQWRKLQAEFFNTAHKSSRSINVVDAEVTKLLEKFRSMSDMVEYFLTKHECKILSVMDDQNKVVNDCFHQIAGQFRQRNACDQSETTKSHKSGDVHPNESINVSFEPLHRKSDGNRVPECGGTPHIADLTEFGIISNGEVANPNADLQCIMSPAHGPAFDLDEIAQPDIDRYIFGGSFPDYTHTEAQAVKSDVANKWSISNNLVDLEQLQQSQQLHIDPTQPTNPTHPTTNLYEDIQQIQREHVQPAIDMYNTMDNRLNDIREKHRETIRVLAQRYSAIDLKYLNNICRTTFKRKLNPNGFLQDALRNSFFHFSEYFECREFPQSRGGKWIAISKIYDGPDIKSILQPVMESFARNYQCGTIGKLGSKLGPHFRRELGCQIRGIFGGPICDLFFMFPEYFAVENQAENVNKRKVFSKIYVRFPRFGYTGESGYQR